MTKKTVWHRFKSYLAIYGKVNAVSLVLVVVLAQYLGGWGAVVFSFFGTFCIFLAIEHFFKLRLL